MMIIMLKIGLYYKDRNLIKKSIANVSQEYERAAIRTLMDYLIKSMSRKQYFVNNQNYHYELLKTISSFVIATLRKRIDSLKK